MGLKENQPLGVYRLNVLVAVSDSYNRCDSLVFGLAQPVLLVHMEVHFASHYDEVFDVAFKEAEAKKEIKWVKKNHRLCPSKENLWFLRVSFGQIPYFYLFFLLPIGLERV